MGFTEYFEFMRLKKVMNTREIKVYKDLMGANDQWAGETRNLLLKHRMLMLNLIGSPGSGKTSMLEKLVEWLDKELEFAVLEGDVETTRDAERLDSLNVRVSQLLSGGACHLEAKLVHNALRDFPLPQLDLVFVENVGNMVCPAEFDVGEKGKVAILSVTEGEDKPLKYPLLFREASAVVVTKTDLLPYLPYDIKVCRTNIHKINADIPIFELSAITGEGFPSWVDWLLDQMNHVKPFTSFTTNP